MSGEHIPGAVNAPFVRCHIGRHIGVDQHEAPVGRKKHPKVAKDGDAG
jgi:hypothetical protein